MLQYFLNASAIWLLSLVLFEIFLKKQSHHGYNRAYLLLTFIAGMLLPLWQWQERIVVGDSAGPQVQQANAVALLKHNVTAAQPVQTLMSFEDVLLLVYAGGVAVGLLLLLKEVFILLKLYRNGLKSKEGLWTLVETGKKHSPFSAFNMIFISSKEDYSDGDLRTIMLHEQQHVLAYHLIDLLLMQIAKVLFWFHPLVYIYHQRLMMVHEYQADRASVGEAGAYGKFLLEQAMLHRAPGLTHSFNRSPIKNRITMLTRSSYSRARFLLPLPLMAVFILCFTKNSFSGERKLVGNKLKFNGNVFEMKVWPIDTIIIEDPITGETAMKVSKREPSPITINGERIYESEDVTVPALLKNITQDEFNAQLAERFKPSLTGLSDGTYTIYLSSWVVDKNGKVVYYDDPFIQVPEQLRKDKATEVAINKVIAELGGIMSSLQTFEPAEVDTKPVASYFTDRPGQYKFEVKNHVVTLVE